MFLRSYEPLVWAVGGGKKPGLGVITWILMITSTRNIDTITEPLSTQPKHSWESWEALCKCRVWGWESAWLIKHPNKLVKLIRASMGNSRRAKMHGGDRWIPGSLWAIPRLRRDPVSSKRESTPGNQHQSLSCDPPTNALYEFVFSTHVCTQTTPHPRHHTADSDPYPRDMKSQVSIFVAVAQAP